MSAKGLIQLAMDQASRMQRAREMGFGDDTVYRGLNSEYDPEKAGHYQFFTSSPQDAGEYGNSVLAAKIKRGNNLEYDAQGRNFNNLPFSGLPAAVYDNFPEYLKSSLSQTARSDEIAHAAKAAGYDSVTLKNIYDKADNEIPLKPAPDNISDADLLSALGIDLNDPILSGNLPQRQEAIVAPKDYNTANVDIVFDPANIRSVNAAFDPAKKDSSDLLGSADPRLLAATALGTGTAVAAPKAQGLLETIGSGALELLTGAAQGVAESVDDFATYGNPRGGIGRAISPQQAQKIQSAVNNVPGLLDTRALQHLQDQEHLQDRDMAGLLRNIGSVVGGLLSPI